MFLPCKVGLGDRPDDWHHFVSWARRRLRLFVLFTHLFFFFPPLSRCRVTLRPATSERRTASLAKCPNGDSGWHAPVLIRRPQRQQALAGLAHPGHGNHDVVTGPPSLRVLLPFRFPPPPPPFVNARLRTRTRCMLRCLRIVTLRGCVMGAAVRGAVPACWRALHACPSACATYSLCRMPVDPPLVARISLYPCATALSACRSSACAMLHRLVSANA